MLNASAQNDTNFPAQPNDIYVVIVMFSLGVFSNGLAIVTLISYKYRKVSTRRVSFSSQAPSFNTPLDSGLAEVKPKKRRIAKFGAFHALVLCLAILDLLGTVCLSPVTFILYSKRRRIRQEGGVQLCNYSAFAMMFFGFATMTMVMAMSIERLLSINHAFFYHNRITAKKAVIVVLGLFLLISILCAMPMMGFGAVRPMFPYTWCFADWNVENSNKDKAFNFLYAGLGILTLLTTMFCNTNVARGLLKMRNSSGAINRRKKRSVTMESQMIIQLLVISIIFAMCWLPLMIRIILNQLGLHKCNECDRVAIWMAAINPILDPWVYILFRNRFRHKVMRVAKFIFCFNPTRMSNGVTTKFGNRKDSESATIAMRLTVPEPHRIT